MPIYLQDLLSHVACCDLFVLLTVFQKLNEAAHGNVKHLSLSRFCAQLCVGTCFSILPRKNVCRFESCVGIIHFVLLRVSHRVLNELDHRTGGSRPFAGVLASGQCRLGFKHPRPGILLTGWFQKKLVSMPKGAWLGWRWGDKCLKLRVFELSVFPK